MSSSFLPHSSAEEQEESFVSFLLVKQSPLPYIIILKPRCRSHCSRNPGSVRLLHPPSTKLPVHVPPCVGVRLVALTRARRQQQQQKQKQKQKHQRWWPVIRKQNGYLNWNSDIPIHLYSNVSFIHGIAPFRIYIHILESNTHPPPRKYFYAFIWATVIICISLDLIFNYSIGHCVGGI